MSAAVRVNIQHGDCRDVLKNLPDNSIDSIVTDPPYELSDERFEYGGAEAKRGGFMGRWWDGAGIAFDVEMWKECLRVLKPGGHMIVFGAERRMHRVVCAIEDAGFYVRASGVWASASSFPKSMNVSKAIDQTLGRMLGKTFERPIIGLPQHPDGYQRSLDGSTVPHAGLGGHVHGDRWTTPITGSATPEAAEWDGWGTALKTIEPWVLVRKKPDGTIAQNLMKWGVGAINIGKCRVPVSAPRPLIKDRPGGPSINVYGNGLSGSYHAGETTEDRWPSSLICSDLDILGPAAGVELLGGGISSIDDDMELDGTLGYYTKHFRIATPDGERDETLTVVPEELLSRIIPSLVVCPKTSVGEREMGCDELPARWVDPTREDDGAGRNNPRAGAGRKAMRRNIHPTVKPIALMRHLIRMITPPGGTVFDPFVGSGSSAAAAVWEGMDFEGAELNDSEAEPFVRIANARANYALTHPAPALTARIAKQKEKDENQTGFEF